MYLSILSGGFACLVGTVFRNPQIEPRLIFLVDLITIWHIFLSNDRSLLILPNYLSSVLSITFSLFHILLPSDHYLQMLHLLTRVSEGEWSFPGSWSCVNVVYETLSFISFVLQYTKFIQYPLIVLFSYWVTECSTLACSFDMVVLADVSSTPVASGCDGKDSSMHLFFSDMIMWLS